MSWEHNPSNALAREITQTSKRGPTPAQVAREVRKDPERMKKIALKKQARK